MTNMTDIYDKCTLSSFEQALHKDSCQSSTIQPHQYF